VYFKRGHAIVFIRWKCWDWGSFQFLWCVSEISPLTLALSPWERGLTVVFGRGTPTWDTELNSGF